MQADFSMGGSIRQCATVVLFPGWRESGFFADDPDLCGRGDQVVAVASLAFDPIVSQAASLMEQGQTILKSEIV